MRVGFIHGVMNTDNMTVSGETIDYGPCAFMDTYDPKTVFSSIDKMGRYAYCNQPAIAKWNLARFAECLIPLIGKDFNKAVEIATQKINSFEKLYEEKWIVMMSNKLGLSNREKNDKSLILDLLTWMHQKKADYTNTFCNLMDLGPKKEVIYNDVDFVNWKKRWKERVLKNENTRKKSFKLMRKNNPLVIPRNHMVEEALTLAEEGNLELLNNFLDVLKDPYNEHQNISNFQSLSDSNKKYETFCGT